MLISVYIGPNRWWNWGERLVLFILVSLETSSAKINRLLNKWVSECPSSFICCCCSVPKFCPTLCDPYGLQHTRLPCPLLSPRVCPNSCPLSQWCYPIPHPLSPFSPFAFSLFQHRDLFHWVGSSHQVAKVLELPFQH